MLYKINTAVLTAVIGLKCFFSNLKNDERGMEVVQVVMLILVGVLAITMVWGLLSGWLNDLWVIIIGKGSEVN
jgi:hypothetical protein